MLPGKSKIYTTIQEQVYNRIKQNILSETYPQGYHLQEKELAAELGVSRSPVREALKSLSAEGLTESVPHKGVIVKILTEKEICEIYELRAILEYAALENTIKVMNNEAIEKFNSICEQLEKVHENHNLSEYTKYDTAFHDYLMYLWGNQTIYKMWKDSFAKLQSFRVRSLQNKTRFNQSLEEHLGIAKGLINKDLKTAWKWDQIHLSLARDTILEYLRSNR